MNIVLCWLFSHSVQISAFFFIKTKFCANFAPANYKFNFMKPSAIFPVLAACAFLFTGCTRTLSEITEVSFDSPVTIMSNIDEDATVYDDGLVNFCTIVKVSDTLYYLYYTSMGKEGPTGDFDQRLCFAWSTDGFHYHRSIPEGVNAPYPGTNVISMEGIIEMDVCMVNDEEFPFRMVACILDRSNVATLYKSADGVNFTLVNKLTRGGNDTQNAVVTRDDSLKVFVRGHFDGDRRAVSLLTCTLDGKVLSPQSILINLPFDELYQSAASDLDGEREILFPTFYDRNTSYQELRCYIVDGKEFRRVDLDTGRILSDDDKSVYAAPGLVEIAGERYLLYQTRDSDHEHFNQKTTISRLKLAKVIFRHSARRQPS